MEIITKNAKETKEFGKKFGSSLKGGEVIALVGDLGAGKTTFVQGLAEGLGLKSKIVSPTFILMRQYSLESGLNFYHADLYRLEGNVDHEVVNLGLPDIWEKKDNIVVVEWAEKSRELFPKNTIWINFDESSEDERRIKITQQ